MSASSVYDIGLVFLIKRFRLMFWTEGNTEEQFSSAIRSGYMSGTASHIIVSRGLWEPTSLTLDYHKDGGRLFWVDRLRSSIESCKLDGSDRVKLMGKF